MALGARLLRAKTEGPWTTATASAPLFARRTYSCVRMKLPWEVSEETFTDNIEGEALEDKLMGMFTTQLGLDMEDLHWNGDTADVSADADFLT